jgi:NTE family protein
MPETRIAVVLSAGGLRGAAHVGVLRQLVANGVPIHAIVGVSAGAVVAAYYAAVGLDFDDLIRDARAFRGRYLIAHSLNVQLAFRFDRQLARRCGVIPERLRQLEAARFDRLCHGIQKLGIVCYDSRSRRSCYFSTGASHGVTLADTVRASASIPRLFPPVRVVYDDRERLELTDGGIADAVPIAFARSPNIGATHVIVSDCRWIGRVGKTDRNSVWIRPHMRGTGTLWSPSGGLVTAIRDGEAAVTGDAIHEIRAWDGGDPRPDRSPATARLP